MEFLYSQEPLYSDTFLYQRYFLIQRHFHVYRLFYIQRVFYIQRDFIFRDIFMFREFSMFGYFFIFRRFFTLRIFVFRQESFVLKELFHKNIFRARKNLLHKSNDKAIICSKIVQQIRHHPFLLILIKGENLLYYSGADFQQV